MYIHDLDPILFDFGFFVIRWYSLAYILGILIGWWLGKKIILKKFKSLNKNLEEIEELVEFQTIIKKIANQMKLDSGLVLQRYYFYKRLKII